MTQSNTPSRETTPVAGADGDVVVLVTARPEGLKALEWAIAQVTTSPQQHRSPRHLHAILASGDQQAGPAYVAPSLRSDVERRLDSAGIAHDVRVETEDPAQAVVDIAERTAASLVVLGTRRRSPTLKLILGSYTQQILLDAPCPVVAVKA